MSDDEIQVDSIEDIEEEIQDWKLLNKSSNVTIPKRGEKEFEPDGTNYQTNTLNDSRNAMFEALNLKRQHHVKNSLIGVWIESSSTCYILHAKGNYFKDMGRHKKLNNSHLQGVIELNPIETVYLVERGSMIVYLSNEKFDNWLFQNGQDEDFDYDSKLLALDLEYLYSLSDISLSKYQAFTYLKRLGYIIQEYQVGSTNTEDYPIVSKSNDSFWILPRQWGIVSYPLFHTLHFKTRHYFKYTDVYKSIRLNIDKIRYSKPENPYHLTFNVWKPTPNFSKKAPPLPDFQISVIDCSKRTDFLKFNQIQQLFTEKTNEHSAPPQRKMNIRHKLKPESKKEIRAKRQAERQSKLDISIQLRNEYLRKRDENFKNGNGEIIIALIDNGIINFIQLSNGNFNCKVKTENIKRLDEIYPGRDHSIIYNDSKY